MTRPKPGTLLRTKILNNALCTSNPYPTDTHFFYVDIPKNEVVEVYNCIDIPGTDYSFILQIWIPRLEVYLWLYNWNINEFFDIA